MLYASNISKSYADRTLFREVDLSVASGDCIALIGANGSGKTTLLDILAGLTLADTGAISGAEGRHHRIPQAGARAFRRQVIAPRGAGSQRQGDGIVGPDR